MSEHTHDHTEPLTVNMDQLAQDVALAIRYSPAILQAYPGGLDVTSADVRPALAAFLLRIVGLGIARSGDDDD